MLPSFHGGATSRTRFCVLVLVLLCGVAVVASALNAPAAPQVPAAAAEDEDWLNDIRQEIKRTNDDFEKLLDLVGATPLADSDANAASEVGTSTSATTSTSTSTTTTKTTTTSTTTTTPVPTTTTTSSRWPSPETTKAPKVAQWTGISVAIVAVAGLTTALVLCKLRTKEQCCFAPKPREVTILSPSELAEKDNGSASEDSASARGDERSFHEAAVDEDAPRRSLLDINPNASRVSGDSDSDSLSDDEEDEMAVTGGNDVRGFSPAVTPPLPPIGYATTAAAVTPTLSNGSLEGPANWTPLATRGVDEPPTAAPGMQPGVLPQNPVSILSKPRY